MIFLMVLLGLVSLDMVPVVLVGLVFLEMVPLLQVGVVLLEMVPLLQADVVLLEMFPLLGEDVVLLVQSHMATLLQLQIIPLPQLETVVLVLRVMVPVARRGVVFLALLQMVPLEQEKRKDGGPERGKGSVATRGEASRSRTTGHCSSGPPATTSSKIPVRRRLIRLLQKTGYVVSAFTYAVQTEREWQANINNLTFLPNNRRQLATKRKIVFERATAKKGGIKTERKPELISALHFHVQEAWLWTAICHAGGTYAFSAIRLQLAFSKMSFCTFNVQNVPEFIRDAFLISTALYSGLGTRPRTRALYIHSCVNHLGTFLLFQRFLFLTKIIFYIVCQVIYGLGDHFQAAF